MSARRGGLLGLFFPLVFCAVVRASPPFELQFPVDVTQVDDTSGLLHALGWPVVAGDRIDASIRVHSDAGGRLRGRLHLTCGRLDFEHPSLRFTLQGGGPEPLRLHWLGGTTLRLHGGRALRVLASIRPATGGGHTLSIDLHSLEEGESDLHDVIRGSVGRLRRVDTFGGAVWLPVAIGVTVALVAAMAGFAMLRRRREEESLSGRPRILR